MACCGKAGGAKGQYVAKANDGTVKKTDTDTEARMYLASHGGGTVGWEPKKA